MARCKSLDDVRQILLDGGVELEICDPDSDSDVSYSLEMDTSGETEDSDSNSSDSVHIEKEVKISPVLSLKCLHDDNVEEENESSGYGTESKLEFVDIDDVPELLINSDQEDNNDLNHASTGEEEHPHLVPLIKSVASGVCFTSATHTYSSVPARNNWDGPHNFKIRINYGESSKKSDSPIFSEEQNKLYVTKDHPFKVLVTAENVPIGSVIKVTAVFLLIEHSYEVVQRCPTHAQQDFAKGLTSFEHFVQCFCDAAVYEKNHENGQLSVSVMYEKPQEGETYSTYLFKLTCFSSCFGGLNRRPFILIFTLENDNIPLGRQTLEAKVCACPMRDFKLDTERRDKKTSKTNIKNNSSKESSQGDSEKSATKYSIVVKDPELYLYLKQMKVLYETSAYSANIMPDT